MRVLAVDDEQSILELLTEALPILGCDDVHTASNAQEALDLLSTEQPDIDCFLLDIQMPLIDGISLCGTIRKIERYKNVPIIMLTAMSEKSYVDQAFQQGATDYLAKPFDMSELSTRLNLAVNHRPTPPALIGKQSEVFTPPVQEKDALETIDRVISLTAFENYVLQLTRARLVTAGLFAIKVPELAEPPRNMPKAEVIRWKSVVAQSISQATQYDQSIVSYANNGVFLVLNKSWGTNKKEVLKQSIENIFLDLDTSHRSANRQLPTIVVGSTVSLPAFGRSFTLSYLQKAIRRAEELCELSVVRVFGTKSCVN